MTLLDALLRLHHAGRLASPWRAGMLVEVTHDYGAVEMVRLAAVHADNAGWSWGATHEAQIGSVMMPDDAGTQQVTYRLVVEDAATVGALLAQLREAAESPHARIGFYQQWRVDMDDEAWPYPLPWAPTEGEAIQAALVALAEALG